MALISILTASLVGSLHCAGMCGGFAGYCAAHSEKSTTSQISYNLGRLLTYTFLGAVAGFTGSLVDLGGRQFGVQHVMAILTGVFLIFWGVSSFFASRSSDVVVPNIPGVKKLYGIAMKPDAKANWTLRSLSLGTLSGALPCGWLYSFVAIAAASGGILSGMAVMATFWLGTVPILTAFGSTFTVLARRFGRRLPQVTAVLLIAAGFFSLSGHVAPLMESGGETSGHHHCSH